MSILIGLLTAVHVLVALFVILLVLMQKSSDQGVGAAFGGGMTETVFGAGTTTALVRMTIWCAGLLLITTLALAVLHSHRTKTGAFPFASQPPAPATPNTGTTTPSTVAPAPSAPSQQAPATSQPNSAPKSP
jgi:preprotein translocase subunit SecG